MVSTVNILVPPKTAAKKPKGEAKSLGTKERKTQTQDVAMVEVPAKREPPKQEKKKIQSVRRKNAPKNSVRRKKEADKGSNHETNTPSIRHKKAASPAPSEEKEKVVEKKKDEGSKNEVKKAPEKAKKTMNLELATKFFKQMASMESRRREKTKTRDDDLSMDVMPESSRVSKRSRKSRKHKRRHEPLDRNIFKENGEPIWVVPDRKPGDKQVFNEEGELVKNPELMAALEDEQLELEDGKGWILKITSFLGGEMADWKTYTKEETLENMDPFVSEKVLQKRAEFFSKEAVIYNTSDAILQLSHNAIERFSQQSDDGCPRRMGPPSRELEAKEPEEKTCVDTTIRFNSGPMFCISYDRRDPIESIQKFKKKYRDKLMEAMEVEKKGKRIEKEVGKDKDEVHTKREELKKDESKKEELKKEESKKEELKKEESKKEELKKEESKKEELKKDEEKKDIPSKD